MQQQMQQPLQQLPPERRPRHSTQLRETWQEHIMTHYKVAPQMIKQIGHLWSLSDHDMCIYL